MSQTDNSQQMTNEGETRVNEAYRNGTQKIWAYIIGIGIMCALAIAISLLHDINRIREEQTRMAISQAGVISQTVFAAMRTNMEKNSPSLIAGQMPQSDPSVKGSTRSTQATSGDKNGELAKFNHSFVVELMDKLLGENGFHVNLVGRDTFSRPDFRNSDWERISFDKIVKGSGKEFVLEGTVGNRIFRYMEPLKVDAGCISCHGQQGYNIGDIPNAISISFPYSPFGQSARRQERGEIITHLLTLMLMLSILFFVGRKIVELAQTVQATEEKVRTLESILPMCMNCHKIRKEGASATDQAGWVPVADYIRGHSESEVSHGICPECMEKLYGPGGSLTDS